MKLSMVAALLLAGAARADTFYVSKAGRDDPGRDGRTAGAAWASLAYACEQVPAGPHTVAVGPGRFLATRTARPKAGVTVAGAGRAGDGATTIFAAKTWTLSPRETMPKPPAEFLIAAVRAGGVTVRDLALASSPDARLTGAVYGTGSGGLRLDNLAVTDFRWAGVYVEHSTNVTVSNCDLTNASTEKDRFHSGALRTIWLKKSEVHHCRIVNTVGTEYGYKGGGHEGVRFHHNLIDVRGEFAFESAHENEFGLEIDRNRMNRCISVPKGGQGADPNSRGYKESVYIHHNVLTDSYTVEGPRNHLRLSHNHIAIEKTGGRVYSQHGGANSGPVWIHHNVVENVDRAFVWKNRGRAEGVQVFNNTVYCADAGSRAAAVIDVFSSDAEPVRGWVVKDNVLVAPASQPRRLLSARADPGVTASHNLCLNLTAVPPGNPTGTPPGFTLAGGRPTPFYAPASRESFAAAAMPPLGAVPFGGELNLDDVPPKE